MSAENRYKELTKEIRNQLRIWDFHLNTAVGVGAFATAISCLGTDKPNVWATLSLIAIILVWLPYKRVYFPERIEALRVSSQNETDDKRIVEAIFADYALKRLNEDEFRPRELLTRTPMLVFGILFLTGVAAIPILNLLWTTLTLLTS